MAKEATQKFAGRPDSAILNRMARVALKVHLVLAAAFSILLTPVVVGIFLLSDRGYPVVILCAFVGWTVMVGAAFFRFYRTDNPPTGIAIPADQAPNLQAIVQDIAAQFDSVTVHRVVLTTDFGASAYTRTAWHNPFGKKHELRLGVLLFFVDNLEGLQSTIAHECHHFQHATWTELIWIRPAFSGSWGGQFVRILRPARATLRKLHLELWALHQVIARRRECQADRVAGHVTGKFATALSLVRSYTATTLYQDSIPPIRRGQTKDPPTDFFELHAANFQRLFENNDNVRNAIRQAFIEIEPAMDVHPSLAERTRALGFDDEKMPSEFLQAIMEKQSTVIQTLGAERTYLTQKLNELFVHEERESWNAQYEYERELEKQLVPLEQVQTSAEAWALYYHFRCLRNNERATFALIRLLELSPGNKLAQPRLDCLKLKQGDLSVIANLRAYLDSPSLEVAECAYETLADHFAQTGDRANLFLVGKHASALSYRRGELEYDKRFTGFRTKFVEAGIPPGIRTKLRDRLSEFRFVTQVFVARKRLPACLSTRFLVFNVRLSQLSMPTEKKRKRIEEAIASVTYDETEVRFDSPFSITCRKIRNAPNSRIVLD